MDEASALRDLSHKEIDRTIERRREWREIALQRWNKTGTVIGKHHNILGRRRKEITEETVENLHELADILLTSTVDFKLVVSGNQGHVYTNELTFVNQLDQLPYFTQKHYSQAEVTRPKNTIQLKNPKYKLRSYFKRIKVTAEQKDQLKGFLTNQTTVRRSPALDRWIASVLHRTEDYFFIDHDNMQWLTMLALVRPGLIRKTMQIIPTK